MTLVRLRIDRNPLAAFLLALCLTVLPAILAAQDTQHLDETLGDLINFVEGNAPGSEPASPVDTPVADTPPETANVQELIGAVQIAVEQQREYNAFRIRQENNKFWLLIGILAASTLVLYVTLTFVRHIGDLAPDNVVAIVGLILVINGAIFISVYAPTDQQMTAPIGILGAIAGYLFGQAHRRDGGRTPRSDGSGATGGGAQAGKGAATPAE